VKIAKVLGIVCVVVVSSKTQLLEVLSVIPTVQALSVSSRNMRLWKVQRACSVCVCVCICVCVEGRVRVSVSVCVFEFYLTRQNESSLTYFYLTPFSISYHLP
jgi:hypothetical protein